MGSAPARLAIIVAAVVVGAVVIGKGFESPAARGSQTPITPRTSTSPGATPSPTPTATHTGGNNGGPKAKQQGVVLAVFNATDTNGLADSAGKNLTKVGYVIKLEANYPNSSTTTIVYYQDRQGKLDAGLLKDELTNATQIKSITAAQIDLLNKSLDKPVPDSVELLVVLGGDYASTHPVPNG